MVSKYEGFCCLPKFPYTIVLKSGLFVSVTSSNSDCWPTESKKMPALRYEENCRMTAL